MWIEETQQEKEQAKERAREEATVATYKDLRFVWPYGKLRLEQLEIVHEFGEHGKLMVTGMVAEEKEDEIMTHASANDHIGVYRVFKDDRKQPLFLGQLHHVELHAARDGVRVQLEVLSHTYDFAAWLAAVFRGGPSRDGKAE